jgi:cytoskeletal protein RodZ
MTGMESLPPLMKTRKNQSTSHKNPSTTLHVVSSREAKPKGAADITSAASKLTPGLRLAERLQAARNERGFSLETMSQKSKVALRYVCMFEEGRYPMVADPAYLTSFVRRYAASLGLNALEAAREFIAETEYSPSPLHARDSAPAETLDAKRLMARRMPKLGRHSWSGPLSSRRGRPFQPGRFKFYAGPLALIAAVVMVGPFSPLYVWDKTLPSVSKTASPLEASRAILTEATAEASHEPALVAASPALAVAALPPVAEVSPPSVDASVPTAVQVVVRDVSAPPGLPPHTGRPPRVLPRSQSSTNKASDALRQEQLARMRAAAAAQ